MRLPVLWTRDPHHPSPWPSVARTPSATVVPGRPPRWQRRFRRHRRWLAAVLAGVATWSVLTAVRPAPAPTVVVLVARHDLVAGATVGDDDVALEPRPEGTVPHDVGTSLAAARGRTVVLPLRAGEPVRARDLLTDTLLDQLGPGTVAAAVRLADPAAASLLGAGDVVDVLSAQGDTAGAATAWVVATAVRVLVAPRAQAEQPGGSILGGSSSSSAATSAVLVLATSPSESLALARAQVSGRLSVVLRRPA